jgi:hypothetical protein
MTRDELVTLLEVRDRELFDQARLLVVATHAREAALARLEGVTAELGALREELRQLRDHAQALQLRNDLAERRLTGAESALRASLTCPDCSKPMIAMCVAGTHAPGTPPATPEEIAELLPEPTTTEPDHHA